MNLAVIIASRGRPVWLTGALTSLWRSRSGLHDIGFLVGIDEDDTETAEAVAKMAEVMPVAPRVFSRPGCLGSIHNALLAESKDADLVSTWNDRNFSLTLGWDDGLRESSEKRPNRVLWWASPQDPGCTMPVWPQSYLQASGYKWAPEIFPFWFDDTWVMQVDRLVHGGPALKSPVYYGTERGKTTRGRDFGFWGDVFRRTLPVRIAEAQDIARALGLEWQDHPDLIEEFEKEAEFFAANAQRFEDSFGDPREPGPEYLAAKARAEQFLKEAA